MSVTLSPEFQSYDMKLLTSVAICLVGFSLLVNATNVSPPPKLPWNRVPGRPQLPRGDVDSSPSRKNKFEEGIKDLLGAHCYKDDTCDILVFFAATLCATPSVSATCQSDCKFVLQYLWDVVFVKTKPNVKQLQKFVPDHCAPSYRGKKNLRESNGWTPEDQDDQNDDNEMSPFAHEGKTHNMLHLGFDFDEDEEIREAVAELKAVVQDSDSDSVTCLAPVPKSPRLKPGQIHKRPCEEVFPFQNGTILGVCLASGLLYYSNVDCSLDMNRWIRAADDYKRNTTAMLMEGSLDAQVVFDDAATLLSGVSDFLDSKLVKDFLPIAEKLGNILGPVGIAFQLVAFFLPKTDPKHEEIMAAFKRLEEQNSEIKNAIERLPNIFKKELFDARIEEMVTNLIYLEGDIELFSGQNTEAFRNKVEKSCANFPADKFINDITQIFISKSPDYVSQLYGYHHKEYAETLAKPILVYSVRATQVALKCLGLDKATTESDTKYYAKTLEERVKVMYGKINYIDEDWIPNNAMANWIDTDLTEFMEKNKGQDHQTIANSLQSYLAKKYDFYKFAVVVYNKVSSTKTAARSYKCFKCVGVQFSGMYFSDKQYDKSVQIMYSKTYVPDIEDKVKAIYDYAAREDLQDYVDYLSRGTIRNSMACRFGEVLRTSLGSGNIARFYNIQSTSTIVTY